jgi:xylose isomerase
MYFNHIPTIQFEGLQTQNPLSYRYYQADKKILGKTMAEHLRIAICFWHTFCWQGNDIFGDGTFNRHWLTAENPLKRAENRAIAAFEFFQKLGVPFYTFHDRDVSPESDDLKTTQFNLQHMAEFLQNQMQ